MALMALLSLLGFAPAPVLLQADQRSSASYSLSSESFSAGGSASSSDYRIRSGSTEPIAGQSTSAGYRVQHGFVVPPGTIGDPPRVPGSPAAAVAENPSNFDPEAAGSYFGLLTDGGGVAVGSFSLKANSAGAITGTLVYNGIRFRVKGQLAANGSFDLVLVDRDGNGYPLAVQLVATPNGFRLVGTLNDQSTILDFGLDRTTFHARTNPTPLAGIYTALIPSSPLQTIGATHPQGDGWGTVKLAANGKIRLAGQLGDGTRISFAGVVSEDGTWRVYKALYRTRPVKGSIGGTVTFREVANVSDFDGALHWRKLADTREKIYPDGFDMEVTMIGSEFVKPYRDELLLTQLSNEEDNATWELGEGNLGAGDPGEKTVSWGLRKIVYAPVGGERLSVRASSSNGAVSGRYTDRATGLRVAFRGVVFQKQGVAAGTFVGDGESGYFLMQPVGGPTLQVRSFAGDVQIANGDVTPDGGDGTDFGDAGVDGGYAERSFRLRNTGTSNLFILDPPTVSGDGFALVACRIGSIEPGGEILLTVRFDPAAPGPQSGVVTIHSNDKDFNPFTFDILANGVSGGLVNDDGVGGSWTGTAPPAPSAAPTSAGVAFAEAQVATYFGLLSSQHADAAIPGTVQLKLAASGALTGTVEIDGVRHRVKSVVAANGSANVVIATKGGGADLVLALQVHQVDGSGAFRIRGTLTQDAVVHDVDLLRNDFGRDNPASQAGAYTMLTIADDDLGDAYPGGESSLVVSVGTNGKIRAVGTLGDGDRISVAGFLSDDGEWPLFKSLYRTRPKGHIGGVLTFRDLPNVSDFDGTLQWLRRPDVRGKTFPFGFKLRVAAVGSEYIRPDQGRVALDDSVAPLVSEFRLQGGGLPASIMSRIDWLAGGKAVHVPTGGTEVVKVRINERNGSIRASYKDGALNLRSINAVVFQKQNIASGQFLNGKVTGRMTMVAD